MKALSIQEHLNLRLPARPKPAPAPPGQARCGRCQRMFHQVPSLDGNGEEIFRSNFCKPCEEAMR